MFLCLLSLPAYSHTITVEPDGSIHDALRQARELRRNADPRVDHGITIHLKAGRYYMSEPLFLRPEDSGSLESPTVIRGDKGTIIFGDETQQHIQLWPWQGMERILDFNASRRTITIPKPPAATLDSLRMLIADKGQSVEMVVHQRWAIAILRVKALTVNDDSVIVKFLEPESHLEFDHPWPQPVIGGERGNSSYLLRTTEKRQGIEQLVIIDGASYVSFEGITFEHTCWNRPLYKGHVTLQGGFPLIDAYKLAVPGLPWDKDLENQAWVERPVSAVSVSHAQDIGFSNCVFRNTGATALDFIDDTRDCIVSECAFERIGGTAIMAGSFAESPREVHRPYTDLAIRCQGLRIANNRISGVGIEDWGAVAIGCGYVCDTEINGNIVTDCPYSGICVGWGWTPHDTGMRNNLIYNNNVSRYATCLYDAGGIYTLSNQPGSAIRDNVIGIPFPAPYATNNRAFTIYLDARTDGFTISGNQTEAAVGGFPANIRPIRRDEIGDNHPGHNIVFK